MTLHFKVFYSYTDYSIRLGGGSIKERVNKKVRELSLESIYFLWEKNAWYLDDRHTCTVYIEPPLMITSSNHTLYNGQGSGPDEITMTPICKAASQERRCTTLYICMHGKGSCTAKNANCKTYTSSQLAELLWPAIIWEIFVSTPRSTLGWC